MKETQTCGLVLPEGFAGLKTYSNDITPSQAGPGD